MTTTFAQIIGDPAWVSPKMKRPIIELLIRETLQPLESILNSMDHDVSAQGFETLRQIGDRILSALNSTEPEVKKASRAVAAQHAQSIFRIWWFFKSGDDQRWFRIAALLDARAGETIVQLLGKRNATKQFSGEEIPRFTGSVLLQLVGLKRIMELTAEKHPLVRRAAIQALRCYHRPNTEEEREMVMGAIAKALKDKSDGVALEAAMDQLESIHREEHHVAALKVLIRIRGNSKSPAYNEAGDILELTRRDVEWKEV